MNINSIIKNNIFTVCTLISNLYKLTNTITCNSLKISQQFSLELLTAIILGIVFCYFKITPFFVLKSIEKIPYLIRVFKQRKINSSQTISG